MKSTSNTPVNIIYSGVAGTGKTYQLLNIAKQYTDDLPVMDQKLLLQQLVDDLSWREVICLILLDKQYEQQDLVKVPEIVAHEFFVVKAAQNERVNHLNNTVWSVLQTHSSALSQTVVCDHRASQAYFDKDGSGSWYLLADSIILLVDLSQRLLEYRQSQQNCQSTTLTSIHNERFMMASFHQAYGYEEFVEGIRPVIDSARSSAQVSYAVEEGAFLQLCQRALKDPTHRYAMLIDEINRANVARVFGELLSLIEPDKRAGLPNAMQVKLAYSGRAFSVPANVDIYATMNTQDHSLAPLDMALRRRFRFIDCPPQPHLLATIECNYDEKTTSTIKHDENAYSNYEKLDERVAKKDTTIDLGQLLAGINHRIMLTLGRDYLLGHAFLFNVECLEQLQTVLVEQIIPQLVQATGAQLALLQFIFNDESQPYAAQFIQSFASSTQHSSQQTPISDASNRFAGQSIFGGHNLNASSYSINVDLLARKGEFAHAAVYQRLYG